MLFLDGVYLIDRETPVFLRLPPPSPRGLEALIQSISQRIGAYLEREGLLVRDIENTYLQLDPPDESAMNDLLGHSITYRIAIGPQARRKAFTLQAVPAREQENDNPNLAKIAGFSLHAGVAANAHQRRKPERLCRYVARLAVATDRLALTPQGNVRYDVNGFTNVAGAGMRRSDHAENAVSRRHHAYHSGTVGLHRSAGRPGAQAACESHPLCSYHPDTRPPRGPAEAVKIRSLRIFHGVFAPNSTLRHHVTPAGRGKRRLDETKTPAQRRAAMTWAQRLKRVFKIDIETCDQCGGTVKVIASIEDPAVVKRILDHLELRPDSNATPTHPARAPPPAQRYGS